MAESLFKASPQLGHLVQARMQRALQRIFERLWKWAEQWSHDAARVTPVETGQLRRSYFVTTLRTGNTFTIILANHLEYGKWLEFGTRYIAHGHVEAWQYGQPPIMSWPAKDANLQYPKKPTDKSLARWNSINEKAMTVGTGEQMPMVRPTGYALMAKIIEDVQRIVREEMARL